MNRFPFRSAAAPSAGLPTHKNLPQQPFVLAALVLAVMSANVWAGSDGGGRSPTLYGGIGGQGNGQGGSGGGYALAWNGSAIGSGSGTQATSGGYIDGGSTAGVLGTGGSTGITLGALTELAAPFYVGSAGLDGTDGTGAGGTGGGGGGGGAGVYINTDAHTLSSASNLQGGNGGNGGGGAYGGGGGGGGGAALQITSNANQLNLSGILNGGNGGNAANLGGSGGGGDGIAVAGNNNVMTNTGTVTAGNSGSADTSGQEGQGGVGVSIVGNNNTLTNSASIQGGKNFSADQQANAVTLNGSNNTLKLVGGYSFLGNVQAGGGTGNRLELGEASTTSFNLSSLVASASSYNGSTRYIGFDILDKTGSGKLVLEGANTGVGSTEVSAGSLIVGGAEGSTATLNSDVSVENGALLGGHGSIVGDVNLLAGAALNPGNSIGTLHVNGNVNFAPGSTLEIETSADGSNDKLVATGTVGLGGSALSVLSGAGTWGASTTYTIIEASNVNGQFGSVADNLAFLTPTVTYNPTTVVLSLNRNDLTFTSVAQTPNQVATATALQTLPVAAPLVTAITSTSVADARRAYDRSSGEIHANTQAALLDDNRYLREGINSRMLALQGLGATTGELNTNAQGPVFWLQGYGGSASTRGDGNASSTQRNSHGVIFGSDMPLNTDWRLGAALSTGHSDIDDGRDSRADVDSHSLALYLNGQVDHWHLRLGAAHTWHDVDTHRSIQVGSFADPTKASYDANSDQVFGELGYRLSFNGLELEPFAGLTHVRFTSDAFDEKGGEAALSGQAERQDQTYSSLGMRGALPVTKVAGLPLGAQASLAWQHALGQTSANSQLAFDGSSSFSIHSADQARDSALVETGVALQLARQTSLGLSYSGLFNRDVHDNAARLELTVGF